MQISLKLIYLLNLWLDSLQSSTSIPLGQFKELTVLVTLTLFLGQSHVCRISLEFMDGISPNLHRCSTRTSLRVDYFQGHSLVCKISLESVNGFSLNLYRCTIRTS